MPLTRRNVVARSGIIRLRISAPACSVVDAVITTLPGAGLD
jgi:hypothetical protein